MAKTLHRALSADPSEAKRLRNQLHAWLLEAVSDDGRWQGQADPSCDHYGQLLLDELMSIVRVQRSRARTTVALTRQLPPGHTREQP
jgi:hypothetical protein